MCGIAGFTGRGDPAVLDAMAHALRHRGPDDRGTVYCAERGASLAMTRLSIIDVAGGRQPMTTADGRVSIVYNGEVFNAADLRRELTALGRRFTTDHSDTEVVLEGYVTWGEALVPRLNGMFAFVVLDRDRGQLFGARDRFGIKPLYLTRRGGRLTFASELKALLLAPWTPHEVDPEAVGHYLSLQAVPSPLSIVAGVEKLPPATTFTYDLATGSYDHRPFWAPSVGDGPVRSPGEATEIVRPLLEQAIERWSLADVPVACSLSGGLDSSIVTAVAAARSATPIRTFTLGFDDAPELDERALARDVAARYGTDHHEIVISAGDILDELPAMVRALDEPYGGGLPSWFVFAAMAKEVKVGLTGVGGDELFGNYGKWLPAEPRGLLARRSAPALGEWYHPMFFRRADRARFLSQQPREATEDLVTRRGLASGAQNPRDAIAAVDLGLQLPDEFLLMLDRFSMAHGLEARPPFLDNDLADAVLALPARVRTHRRAFKRLLLGSAADLLPPSVRRAGKRGFILPLTRWLRDDLATLVKERLDPQYLQAQGVFTEHVWTEIAAPHLAGSADKTQQLWTLVMFQLWYEQHTS